MSENKTNYIKIYPKTKKLKDSITKLARRNDMTNFRIHYRSYEKRNGKRS